MPPVTEAPSPARGPAPTEQVSVGAHVAVFRPDNHAVALMNASAAALCRALLANPETREADLAGSPTAIELLAKLREAGFLAPAPPQSGASLSPSPTSLAADAVPTSGIYAVGSGPRVRLAVASPALSPLLEAALHPLAVEADGVCNTCLSVVSDGIGFCVSRDGVVIARDLDLADARRATLQAMLMALHPAQSVSAILHASATRIGNRAVLLAGATGSGKSTLAMALAAEGAGWLADDFTGLDATGRCLRTFPVAASVKQGSWPLLRARCPALEDCTVHEVGDRRVRYVAPSPHVPAAALPEQCEIAAIVFPHVAPGAPTELERMTPEATLGQLLATGSEVVGWPRSIAPLAALVDTIPSWSLSFEDLGAAMASVQALANPVSAVRMAS